VQLPPSLEQASVTSSPNSLISPALGGIVLDELVRAFSVPTGCGALHQMRLALDDILAEARARHLPAKLVVQAVTAAFQRAVRPMGDTSEQWSRRCQVALAYSLDVYRGNTIR
jgi:hypothetical protein